MQHMDGVHGYRAQIAFSMGYEDHVLINRLKIMTGPLIILLTGPGNRFDEP